MFKKTISICIAVAIVLSTIFSAAPAKAQTVDINTLLAQIQALTAQLNAVKAQCGDACNSTQPTDNEFAVITIVGQPSMSLVYDSAQKESKLKADFSVRVIAKKDIVLPPNPFYFEATNGKYSSGYSTASDEINSANGFHMTKNSDKTFNLTAYFTPSQMFAGSYSAKLSSISLRGNDGTGVAIYPSYPTNEVKTNSVTIIGETTPYISDINPRQVKSGDTITLTGERLFMPNLYIDGKLQNGSMGGTDKKTAVRLPSTLEAGSHSLQLEKIGQPGLSNIVYFEILGSETKKVTTKYSKTLKLSDGSRFACEAGDVLDTSKTGGKCSGTGCVAGIVVNSISPKAGLTVSKISLSGGGNVNNVTYSSNKNSSGANLRVKNEYDFKNYININATVYCKSTDIKKVACVAEGQTYNDSIQDGGGTCCEGLVPQYLGQTINGVPQVGAPTMCVKPQGATADVISDFKFGLSYGKGGAEAQVGASAHILVTAGSQDVRVLKGGGYITLSNTKDGGDTSSVHSTIVSFAPVKDLNKGSDTRGYTWYIVPKGTSQEFIVERTQNASEMFAGIYRASIEQISILNNQNLIENIISQHIAPNYLTIIGETSPYISSITNPIKAGDVITILGNRLNNTDIFLDGVEIDPRDTMRSTDGTKLYFTTPLTWVAGFHVIELKNTNGLSNRVGFEITGGSTSKQPLITDVKSDKTVYAVGDTYTLTWNFANVPVASANAHIGIGLFNDSGSRVYNLVNTCDYVANCENIYPTEGAMKYTGTIPAGVGTISPTVSNGTYHFEVSLITNKSFNTDALSDSVKVAVPAIACLSGTGPLLPGQTRCSITPTQPIPAPTVEYFQANWNGTNNIITWKVNDATTCSVVGGSGTEQNTTKAVQGQFTKINSGANGYTLTCQGLGGSVTKDLTVPENPVITCLSGAGPLLPGQTRCVATTTASQTSAEPAAAPILSAPKTTTTYTSYSTKIKQSDGKRWACNTGDTLDTSKGGTTRCEGTGCVKGIAVSATSDKYVHSATNITSNGANLVEGDHVSSDWIEATVYCKHKVVTVSDEEYQSQLASVIVAGEKIVEGLKVFVKSLF